MKATLEFNLPDDQVEYIQAVHAEYAWSAVSAIAAILRSHYKHGVGADETLKKIQEATTDTQGVILQ